MKEIVYKEHPPTYQEEGFQTFAQTITLNDFTIEFASYYMPALGIYFTTSYAKGNGTNNDGYAFLTPYFYEVNTS